VHDVVDAQSMLGRVSLGLDGDALCFSLTNPAVSVEESHLSLPLLSSAAKNNPAEREKREKRLHQPPAGSELNSKHVLHTIHRLLRSVIFISALTVRKTSSSSISFLP